MQPIWVGLLACLLLASPLQGQALGFDPAFMDTTCSPCRDFYRYANGAWLDTASFPAAFNTIGVRRDMENRVTETVHQILESVARASADTDASEQKLGAYYGTCMDSTRQEQLGAGAIAPELKRLSAVRARGQLLAAIAHLHNESVPVPFWFGAQPDPKDATRYIGYVWQAGLGLPDREYYLRRDPSSDSLRRAYLRHVTRTFRLLGSPAPRATREANLVLRFETVLARASMSLVAQRNPDSVYHKLTVRELGRSTPGLDWPAYVTLRDAGTRMKPDDSLVVAQPGFIRQVGSLLAQAPISEWQAYLRWQLTNFLSPHLGSAFFREHFDFDRQFSGAAEPLPRWRRCAEEADAVLGDALGRAYVRVAVPADSKARVEAMVENVRAAFLDRIARLSWMSNGTKAQARRKLEAIRSHVAWPAKWRDDRDLAVVRDAPFPINALAVGAFESRRQMRRIGEPVDPDEWAFSAMTVDAFYNPSVNGIFILPGMLQPPRFDPAADDAVNYGSLGTLIGHELTHGFDDEGRKYDAEGNLRDWWSAQDGRRFRELADRIVAQYSAYVAIDTLHVNGELTLGENIADIGGVMIAYDAFKRSLQGKPAPDARDGFTPEQRFFLGYAQGWRRLYRAETMRLRTLTDPHSPPAWRVNGSVAHMPEFARAFRCQEGTPMAFGPGARVLIW
jgi:predicted metalloendopeptidase